MADLRMPDMNKVFVAGRLTRDPELRYLPSGTALCKLGLAVSRVFRTKEGEQREDVVFLNVTLWEKQAEIYGERLKKGRPVLVEGRLTMNEWDDKETGQKRRTIEIRAERIQQLDWDDSFGGQGGGAPRRESRPVEEPVPEDDIPF